MQINILEYLENTVKRLPDKLAFSNGKEGMTFSEVGKASASIGSFVALHGIYREPVVIFMDKHPRTVSAFFGVIYGGCYYVCIDEKMPDARILAILENLRPRLMISDKKNMKRAESFASATLEVVLYDDAVASDVDEFLLGSIRKKQIDTDAIYVVFTSGSTGVPKGVVACHRSVIDYTEHLCEALGFSEDNVFGNQTPLYFDAPLKEIMPTLKFGATTYFVPKVCFSFPVKLIEFLNQYKINTVCWVVSAFVQVSSLGALEKFKPEYLKTVAFGSEVFPKKQYDIWRRTLPDAVFYNLYGPTEATGMSCYWKADRELAEEEPIPVGVPFKNTRIKLIDENGKEANEGEICIGGTCLTMGYYNNPEKTGEVFVQDPTNTSYPELIYRTGDIGRYNEYGELVFVCRRDSQIKHMGHRIELGEIEYAAMKNDGVSRAICLYDAENKRILLFYTGSAEEDALRAYISALLPKYMMPTLIKRLAAFPLTDNGKVDRRGLLATY